MADCERGLGRPERALAMATAPEAKTLDKETQIELRMVAAGARMDMEQPEAAAVLLQGADLTPAKIEPWTARLRYAYAEALLASERAEEAREWFSRANDADTEGMTDAADRVDELDGISFDDEPEDEEDEGRDGDELEDEFDDEDDEEVDEDEDGEEGDLEAELDELDAKAATDEEKPDDDAAVIEH
jgi:hypothetical protein